MLSFRAKRDLPAGQADGNQHVILSPSIVILSEAKDLRVNSAKDLAFEILRRYACLPAGRLLRMTAQV